ncbi:MAG: (Fe-S)-binding protein, partial [Pseudomonadota bacterium]
MPHSPDILQLADRCVMCGLCLPHCPTYRLLRNEADSPRGRIALMQAAAHGELGEETSLGLHLDRCLACRACERMCPSKVEYGRLIDASREQRPPTRPQSLVRLLEGVRDREKLRTTASALRSYQRSGLQWLARKSGLLKGLNLDALEQRLPPIPEQKPLQRHYPARGVERGRVGLFVGCIGTVMEGELHRATITLLTTLGYAVHLPPAQGCCGSLHQHNGESATAATLAEANIEAFADLGLEAIVSTASGCAAQLFEYAGLYGAPLPAPIFEICDFLQRHWPEP